MSIDLPLDEAAGDPENYIPKPEKMQASARDHLRRILGALKESRKIQASREHLEPVRQHGIPRPRDPFGGRGSSDDRGDGDSDGPEGETSPSRREQVQRLPAQAPYRGWKVRDIADALEIDDPTCEAPAGSPCRTRGGKTAGVEPRPDDLRDGEHTALAALALKNADAAQRAVLERLLGGSGINERLASDVREVLDATGARDAVERMIHERRDQAQHVLQQGLLTPLVTRCPSELAHEATARTA